jgi:hypothetical protein
MSGLRNERREDLSATRLLCSRSRERPRKPERLLSGHDTSLQLRLTDRSQHPANLNSAKARQLACEIAACEEDGWNVPVAVRDISEDNLAGARLEYIARDPRADIANVSARRSRPCAGDSRNQRVDAAILVPGHPSEVAAHSSQLGRIVHKQLMGRLDVPSDGRGRRPDIASG